jgi:hypothetical protein
VEEIVPDSRFAHMNRSRIYWLQGKAEQAIAEGKAMGRTAHSAKIEKDYDEVAEVYEKAGARAAEERLARLMAQDVGRNYELVYVALRYGSLKDKPNTLKQIERALRAQESNLLFGARTAPEFDFLVGDPKFESLLRAAGVPQ